VEELEPVGVCCGWRTNAVNLVVASIYEYKIGFGDPTVSAPGWNARVLRVKKLQSFTRNVLE
jgi:hypothetical protein